MVDFRLPELKPANYVNAFAQGYVAPDVMQQPGLANELAKAKVAEEQNKLAAAAEYGKTGNINALRTGFPVQTAELGTKQQHEDIAATVPRIKYALTFGGNLAKPETFEETRQSLVSVDPWFDKVIPKTFTPGWFEQATVNGFKMLVKAGEAKQYGYIDKGGIYHLLPGPTTFQPQGHLTPEEVGANEAAKWGARPPTTVLGTEAYGLGDRIITGPVHSAPPPPNQTIVTPDQAIEQGTVPRGTRIVRPGKTSRMPTQPGAAGTQVPTTVDLPLNMEGTVGGIKYRNINGVITVVK